jgi:hypothetical protein
VCPICGKAWTIKNHRDTHVVCDTVRMSTKQPEHKWLVGKTIAELQSWLEEQKDAVRFFAKDDFLRNDRFIDLTPDPKFPTLSVNERGWVGSKVIDLNSYIIQDGDEFFVTERLQLEMTTHDEILEVVRKAGSQVAVMHAIPNQYCQCEHCAPWFVVETPLTPMSEGLKGLTIGWRKRVINIQLDNPAINFVELFPKENVTKGSDYIHAWGYEKAEEYLRVVFDKLKS